MRQLHLGSLCKLVPIIGMICPLVPACPPLPVELYFDAPYLVIFPLIVLFSLELPNNPNHLSCLVIL